MNVVVVKMALQNSRGYLLLKQEGCQMNADPGHKCEGRLLADSGARITAIFADACTVLLINVMRSMYDETVVLISGAFPGLSEPRAAPDCPPDT